MVRMIQISDVLRRAADVLDQRWDRVRENDPGMEDLNQLLLQIRLYWRLKMGVDLMPGVVTTKSGAPVAMFKENQFPLPFQRRKIIT